MTTATGEWDYTNNARARVNRAIKAERLADAIDDLGHIPDVDERKQLLRTSGVRSASDTTWTLALQIHRERQQ